jgi:hypothetical protein
MMYDEARLKHRALTANPLTLEQRAEWAQIERLERLQRAVRVVQARLGLRTALQ